MASNPSGPQDIKLHDLPDDIMCLITSNVASDADYMGLMLTNKSLHTFLTSTLPLSAWLAACKGEQQAFEFAAVQLRRQDVFCKLLVIFQGSEASALKPQQYARKRKQQQQQAMDSSPLHLACKAGFLEAVIPPSLIHSKPHWSLPL